ncbi:MAG: bifunctional riboflavin kinase/FAD synthetase [Rhodoglobus sp.]|nr:bifunctional riboflavin kinase/FAD synthetase [Rhodoglobus sp.]
MQIFRSLSEIPADFGPSAVTIGKFDGVHAGHRAVIGRLETTARARSLTSVVVTFDRNPLAVLRPEMCPENLVSNEQKLDLLAETGLDAAVMLTFDRELSAKPAQEFVKSILVDALEARVVLAGADFRFGAGGVGTMGTLTDLGRDLGFEVLTMEEVRLSNDRRASSSWIRQLLAEGRVSEAAELLGRFPSVRGTVVHGEQRGRALGYPTANLSPELEGFIPADGVYAAWLTAGGVRYPAAVSVGNNPTFEGVPDKQIEAHALDQRFDLYEQVVEVSFVEYIRGMVKFSGAEALSEQMTLDVEHIRSVLGVAPQGSA